ncbi:MAG: site-specific DNA-methyltransferase [Rhodocyclaceae bacterium]|nr:site-specific DNA-methyltransferase [Rhodocyclaceae bacterium]
MPRDYNHLSREQLVEILQRRDLEANYGLVWERDEIEPEAAINHDYVGLRLDPALSCGPAPWQHLVIEGDNWDALRALAATHQGQVKLIYIDPPYNTGRRDFLYNDRWFEKTHRYRHSVWLEFMYKRLLLARELLAPDGAIFVSIDDNELFNLGLLMNKVFGEENFIANCIWQKAFAPKNSAQHFSDDHEYVLVYAANRELWRPNLLPRTEKQDRAFKNPDNDPRGPWTSGDLAARNFYSEGRYPITCPSGRIIEGPPAGSYWRVSKARFEELDRDGRIWWGKDGNNTPRIKRFLSEVKQGVVPQTLWTYEEVGHTQDAKKQLNEMLPMGRNADVFSTPKPLQLMERILRIGSQPGDLVLDFFAGSGTFGQAVLQLNAASPDAPPRRFILVSNREATAEEPEKNLCRDICAERLRRAIAKLGAHPTAGFAYAVAERIPRHRMVEKLPDALVWSFAQLAHDHPLTLFTRPLAQSRRGAHLLLYAPRASASAVRAVEAALANHAGPATLYTWSPDDYAHLAGRIVVRVPEALLAAFRQGTAGAARAVAQNNEVPVVGPAPASL